MSAFPRLKEEERPRAGSLPQWGTMREGNRTVRLTNTSACLKHTTPLECCANVYSLSLPTPEKINQICLVPLPRLLLPSSTSRAISPTLDALPLLPRLAPRIHPKARVIVTPVHAPPFSFQLLVESPEPLEGPDGLLPRAVPALMPLAVCVRRQVQAGVRVVDESASALDTFVVYHWQACAPTHQVSAAARPGEQDEEAALPPDRLHELQGPDGDIARA